MSFVGVVVSRHRVALEAGSCTGVRRSSRRYEKEQDLLKLSVNHILLLSKRVCEFNLVIV
jgi:hypothetical protein